MSGDELRDRLATDQHFNEVMDFLSREIARRVNCGDDHETAERDVINENRSQWFDCLSAAGLSSEEIGVAWKNQFG